jgi:hypothetical protein
MAFLAIAALCVLAAFAGARGALLVPIVLWPIDRLPWPAALLVAVVAFLAWRAFANRTHVSARAAARAGSRMIEIHGVTVQSVSSEEVSR